MGRKAKIVMAGLAAAIALGAGPTASADHVRCHSGQTGDVWTGVVGVGASGDDVIICTGDQAYVIVNFGDGTVAVRQCDDSPGGSGCTPIVARTGAKAVPIGGPGCVRVTAYANGGTTGPFDVGVCDP